MAMPYRFVCFLSFALTCLASCTQRPLPGIKEPLQGTPQERTERYFNSGIHQFGNSRAEIISNLGKPKRERTEKDLERARQLAPEERRYLLGHTSEPINQISELAYDGLSLRILKVNSPPYREFVYDISVTSDKYKLIWNLNVGRPRQEVRRILGNPSNSDDLKDSYRVVHSSNPEGYTDLVTFGYHEGLIIRIQFWLYLD